MPVAALIESIVGSDPPVRFEAYDGSACGRLDAPARVLLRSPDALRRLLTAPGELGLGRAYVAGDLDIEGDVFAALELRHRVRDLSLSRRHLAQLVRLLGPAGLRPLPPPPEEARLRGLRHSKARDAAAIAHHYDVSNEFYRIVLGPSLTYSCAVWDRADAGLDAAQAAKHELVARKLGLGPGMRVLDVGCGWGSFLIHAAARHGIEGVGVTISRRQAELASKRVADAGLADRVDIRLQDYRDVTDGPYDAVASIGMFEHVGLARLAEYVGRLHELVRPGGRLLNHAISRPAGPGRRGLGDRTRFARRSFIDRFVFPDGELHEVGTVVTAIQRQGFEVRHVESLREHYALTLRAWVANLEAAWEQAVAEAGAGRARVWRLYMAACAVGFEDGVTSVHQTLAVRPDRGRSGMALRPDFEPGERGRLAA